MRYWVPQLLPWVALFLENIINDKRFQSSFLYHYVRKRWKFLFLGLCRVVLNKVWIMNEMFSISNFIRSFGYSEIKKKFEMINYDISICCSYLIYFLISSYITNGIKNSCVIKTFVSPYGTFHSLRFWTLVLFIYS